PRSRADRPGNSEPGEAYHWLPLSLAPVAFAGTRHCHRHCQWQTPASAPRKALDADGTQTAHRLGRTENTARIPGRITRVGLTLCTMLPVAVLENVDP